MAKNISMIFAIFLTISCSFAFAVENIEISGALKKQTGNENISYPSCPICKSKSNVVPIVYGEVMFTGAELKKYEEEHGYVSGGCVIQPEKWFCKVCKKRFK